jgi:molecular chaperone DnaK (HSP70)
MNDMLVLPTLPQAVLIAVQDGDARGADARGKKKCVPLISRYVTIPCKKQITFTNCSDEQTSALIEVYQGWDAPTFFGSLRLAFPKATRGVKEIEVTADIDANGLINLIVEDRDPVTRQINAACSKTVSLTLVAWGIRKDFGSLAPPLEAAAGGAEERIAKVDQSEGKK